MSKLCLIATGDLDMDERQRLKDLGYSVVPATTCASELASANWFWVRHRKSSDTFVDEIQDGTSSSEAEAWRALFNHMRSKDGSRN